MTQTPPAEEEVQFADYYQVSGGYTVGMTVCQDGEVIEGSSMGFTKMHPPLSEEDQTTKYGFVMYKEYTPEEDELAAIKAASGQIRTLAGMQAPGEPPVVTQPTTQPDINTQSREELRVRAKKVGLNFPADTDRDQMIGAIEKKEKEQAQAAAEAQAESAGTEPPPEEEETPTP
jgi:hypothetical protein